MKPLPPRIRRLTFRATLFLLLFGAPAYGQEGFPTPGPEHAVLKRQEGEWIATVKGEGGDSKGTLSARLECGGLWLVTDYHGDFGGQSFHGRGFDGYDPAKKKYVSVWVDSMSTRPMQLEGTLDAAKQVLTMLGEGPGPDGTPVKYKNVTQFTDADHHKFTMSIVRPDGKETPVMTIEYARKK
jgi:hypothetical protein